MQVSEENRSRVVGERLALAPGILLTTPSQQALDAGLDWAARARAPIALLVLHLSHLHAPGPRPHHRRIALNLLDGAVQAHGGRVFACANGDFVLLTLPDGAARLVATLSNLFRVESPGSDRLLALWSLPTDEEAARAHLCEPALPGPAVDDPPVPLGAVAALQAVLAATPADELVRRQTAIRLTRGGMQTLYRELSVSMAALEARTGTPVPFMADPFLFRHLAAQLDRPALDSAGTALRDAGTTLHLNLTVPGILSDGFAQLTAALPRAATLGVEVQFIEALADLTGFAAACRVLRQAGCRLVVDGVDHAMLALARPAAWDPDLVKLDWSPRLPTLPNRERRLLAQAITALGPERIVLHRAATEAALAWGRAQGISRFQGRHVDAMLAAGRLSLCRHAAGCTLRQCIDRAAATGAAGRIGCHEPARLNAPVARASVA